MNRPRSRPLSALLLSCVIACGSPLALHPGAERIQLRKDAPDAASFESVGEVRCEFGANGLTSTANIESCRNDLRNKAQSLGADLVVIETEKLGSSNCANCIAMFGTAYRKAPGK